MYITSLFILPISLTRACAVCSSISGVQFVLQRVKCITFFVYTCCMYLQQGKDSTCYSAPIFSERCLACSGILLINILFLTFQKQQRSTNFCTCDSLARLRFCFAAMDICSYGRIWNIGNFPGPLYMNRTVRYPVRNQATTSISNCSSFVLFKKLCKYYQI